MNEFNENNLNNGEGTEEKVQTPQVPQMPQMPQTTSVTQVSEEPQEQTAQPVAENNVEAPQPAENNTAQQVKEPVSQQTREIPVRQVQPEQRVQQNYASGPNPQMPYGQPQPNYQRPVQPNGYVSGYNSQQTAPNGQPVYNPYQPQQDYYRMTYGVPKPEKQKMSPGLKALVIIIISILTACVIGFTVYIAFNSENNQLQAPTSSTDGYFGGDIFGGDIFGDFGEEYGNTVPTFSQEQSSDQTYDQSDASDKVNPDYKGVELESKPKDKDSEKYNSSYSFNQLSDAVVGVVCYYEEDEGTDNYQSQGTGIIVTSDGYIVTNSHVIGNSRKAYIIKVITADKKEYSAGVVGYDSRSDLAVLKIDGKNLPVAQFGNSDLTEITEDVIAIGNPSGIEFQNSVTKGIVSALEREVSTSNNVEFIQIDAAINPGNSGGPLCNMYGQVIGINTSKIASEEYEGMGFAIPSVTMKDIVDDIIRYGYVTNRVKVGIVGQAVYEANAGADGIMIVEITEGGPMDGTGAQVDDIITAVDGEKVTTFAEIFDILEKHKEGDKVKVTLYRPSENKTFDVEITLQIDKAED